MYNSRVLERGCGLTAPVAEGVHVDDKASGSHRRQPRSRPLPGTHRIDNTKNRGPTQIAFGFQDLYPYPSSPLHDSLSAAAYPDSQAETDPHIQQESAICADMGGC